MRTLTLRRDTILDLTTDEMRDVVAAGSPPITGPNPPISYPVTGCLSRLDDESICACVSTGGTTR